MYNIILLSVFANMVIVSNTKNVPQAPVTNNQLETGQFQVYLQGITLLYSLDDLVELKSLGHIEENWIPETGPVVNQGHCANCWAVSFTEVLTAITNRYVPKKVLQEYSADYKDSDGKVNLSIEQMTQCTSRSFYQDLADYSKKYKIYSRVSDFKLQDSTRIEEIGFNLYGCQGGSWEGAIFSMLNSHQAMKKTLIDKYSKQFNELRVKSSVKQFSSMYRKLNAEKHEKMVLLQQLLKKEKDVPSSPIAYNGLGTDISYNKRNKNDLKSVYKHCRKGFVKVNLTERPIYTNHANSFEMKLILKVHPMATAMAIPGCHSGNLGRGGHPGGISECRLEKFEHILDCKSDMVGCYKPDNLLRKYNKYDIIKSDHENSCIQLAGHTLNMYERMKYFTHQAIIVGWGKHKQIEYWVVKQSWGEEFGIHKGYQKIEITQSHGISPFCIQSQIMVLDQGFKYKDTKQKWINVAFPTLDRKRLQAEAKKMK